MVFRAGRYPRAFALSAVTHCLVVFLVASLSRFALPDRHPQQRPARPHDASHLVWLVTPTRSGGGGGGGGDDDSRPARQLEMRGRSRSSFPDSPPRASTTVSTRVEERQHVPRLDIPVLPSASGLENLPGVVVSNVSVTDSLGPGRAGGAGTGLDGGSGPGAGPGLDMGQNGNAGSGPRRPGGPISDPVLVHETKPAYTPEALRAGIQGVVLLDAVVLPDGSIGPVRIVRSLDAHLGLDQRAVDAVRAWRFLPSRLAGRPVPALVRIELAFTLR